MYTFLVILAIVVCVFLILIVLVQNPKGGGLASNFAGSNQVMGVQKTTDFVEKATWGLAIALLVISLSINFFIPRGEKAGESLIQEQVDRTDNPILNTTPLLPGTTPTPTDTTGN